MPLHADIRINDTLIRTISIGRLNGGAHPDDVNTYVAVEVEPGGALDWWDDNHAKFVHRYGDGAETCVLKALQALGYEVKPKNSKKWDGNGRNYRA
jgi:hypothetical protein